MAIGHVGVKFNGAQWQAGIMPDFRLILLLNGLSGLMSAGIRPI